MSTGKFRFWIEKKTIRLENFALLQLPQKNPADTIFWTSLKSSQTQESAFCIQVWYFLAPLKKIKLKNIAQTLIFINQNVSSKTAQETFFQIHRSNWKKLAGNLFSNSAETTEKTPAGVFSSVVRSFECFFICQICKLRTRYFLNYTDTAPAKSVARRQNILLAFRRKKRAGIL